MTTPAWDQVEALWLWQQMVLIRCFEERLLLLKDMDLVHGPVHAGVGQEAVAAGISTALAPADRLGGTHRAHHHYLAKALNALRGGTPSVVGPLNPGQRQQVRTLLHEVLGLAEGCCGGRGGSMHLYAPEIGLIGTNAIVGGGVPIAAGAAWADSLRRNPTVTVVPYGDGAVYQGVVHETCNLAALWRLPVLFVIENNQYAVATPRSAGCSAPELSDLAKAYGIPGQAVDGMDAMAVVAAVRALRANRQRLPCLLELRTYRHYHHAGRKPGSAYGYRTKVEEAAWLARDPLRNLEERLLAAGADPGLLAGLRRDAEACVEEAAASCLSVGADGTQTIREEAWPHGEHLEHGLRVPLPGLAPVSVPTTTATRNLRYVDAIAEVTGRWLETCPETLVIGEEVANFGGGAYGATKGLMSRFPDRVLNTPITEAGFCGLACGAAMQGMRPVVELMFSSFALVAADQLFNQIGQLGHIYGGRATVPLVVRTRIGAGLGYGAQHSLEPVGLFSQFPGWRIVAPTTPADYIGLFNAAMRLGGPVLVVEHQAYYSQWGEVPVGPADHLVPLGQAAIRRPGELATVVAYGWGLHLALAAATQLHREGLSVEVIDLRTLDDAGLDWETIGASLRKTGVLVTVEEAMGCNGIGAKIAAACQTRWFDWFDAPSVLIHARDIPLPVSRRLETACLPSVGMIADQIRTAIQGRI